MFATLTPIQEHLRGGVIFITGATGFIGSAVVEKIFRTVPDVKKIYMLIRPKKNKNATERLNDLYNDFYWDTVKSLVPNFKDYLCIIDGDLALNNLGMSEEACNIIKSEVTHVFHIAATISFDESLKTAVNINIRATRDLLDLCLECRKLKSVVHVSTAYSQCIRNELEEKFYDAPRDVTELLKICETKSEEELSELTPSFIGEYPNTYTFTKSMSESLIKQYQGKLSISIVRPSIVMGAWHEPVSGWVNNLAGPIGMFVGIGYGLIHVVYSDMKKKTDVVPVDMVANCILAASWKTENTDIKNEKIPIFNYVNSKRNPITWGKLYTQSFDYSYVFASVLSVWCYFYTSTTNQNLYLFLRWLLHTVPGYLVDTVLKLRGKKPMLAKIYKKVHHMQEVLQYFCDREWMFHDDKTVDLLNSLDKRDRFLFNFDITDVKYEMYFGLIIRTMRIHLMKDPISTVPAGRRKYVRLYILHYFVVGVLLAVIGYLFYSLFNIIF